MREAAEAGVYSYVNKERCEDLVDYVPVNGHDDAEVRQAEELALAAWRALGCVSAVHVCCTNAKRQSAHDPHSFAAVAAACESRSERI